MGKVLVVLAYFVRNRKQIKTLDYLARLCRGRSLATAPEDACSVVNWSWQIGLIVDADYIVLSRTAKLAVTYPRLFVFFMHLF